MTTKSTKSTLKGLKKSPTPRSASKYNGQTKKHSSGTVSERWIRQRRAELLATSSDAEKTVYTALCHMGYNVIRQQPINTGRRVYFADLYIPALKTIFELDGGYHFTCNQKRLDTNRSNGIWRMGYHVVRLTNREARDTGKIKAKIRLILAKSLK